MENDAGNSDSLRLRARSHPLRASLSEEMHVRKLPHFPTPTRLMQIVTLVGEQDIEESRSHVEALCARHGASLPTEGKYFVCRLGSLDFVWERHTEVASYTFICPETIEEKVMKLQASKKELVSNLVRTDTGILKRITKEELVELVKVNVAAEK